MTEGAPGAPRVVLYSRAGCHLCEHARDALRRLGNDIAFELREQDVDGDPGLTERYGDVLPVVTVAGRAVSEGRLDAAAVRQALLASRQPAQRADTVDRSCGRS